MADPTPPKNGHGGAREGAGRKPNPERELRRLASLKFSAMYAKEVENIFNALLASALGTVRLIDKDGKVYSKPPSAAAAKELNDRGMGKAMQPIELSDGNNQPDASDETIDKAKQEFESWLKDRRAMRKGPPSSGSA